jgi:hypothetical protein
MIQELIDGNIEVIRALSDGNPHKLKVMCKMDTTSIDRKMHI